MKILFALAIATLLFACDSNKQPVNTSKFKPTITDVTDFDLTLDNKPAVIIFLKENGNRFCSITIKREDIKQGKAVKSLRGDNWKDLSLSCKYDVESFYMSNKHNTGAGIDFKIIDRMNNIATIVFFAQAVNPDNNNTMTISAELTLPEDQARKLFK